MLEEITGLDTLGPLAVNDEALRLLDVSARAALISLAREDSAVFAEHVLRDESTGDGIRNVPMHHEWHALLDRCPRAVIWGSIESGKTQQLTIGRALHRIGKTPRRRGVVLANTVTQSTKIVTTCARYIEHSEEFQEVFPDIRKSVPWTTSHFRVQTSAFRRPSFSKDYTLQAVGAFAKVTGARIDDVYGDDLLDYVNTRTPELRKEITQWLKSEVLGRVTKGGTVQIVGNAYYPDDALHVLVRWSGYVARSYPLLNRKTGECMFPDAWPPERVAQKRLELGPVEAARQLDCQVRTDASSRCPEAWLRKNFANGGGLKPLFSIPKAERENGTYVTISAVDLAASERKNGAKTVRVTVRFWITGPNRGMKEILWINSGQPKADAILGDMEDCQSRYGGLVVVETNATQRFMLQLAQIGLRALGAKGAGEDTEDDATARARQALRELRVRGLNTGVDKWHPVYGVEGLFVEFQKGLWVWPSPDGVNPATQPLADLASECANFSLEAHTGDHLMALWIANQGFRKFFDRFADLAEDDGAGNVEATIPGESNEEDTSDPDALLNEYPEERREELSGWEAALKKP